MTPRMDKFLSTRLHFMIINAFVSLAIGEALFIHRLGFGFDAVIFGAVAAFLLNKFLNFVSSKLIKFMYFGNNNVDFIKETAEAVDDILNNDIDNVVEPKEEPAQLKVTIENKPEKTIGTYQGIEFYEWLDIAGVIKDEIVRFIFIGTYDTKRNPPIPENCLVLPPGIVYQVESTINKND